MTLQKSKPKPNKLSSTQARSSPARTTPPKDSPATQSAPGGQDPGGGAGWGDTGGWEADSWDDLNGRWHVYLVYTLKLLFFADINLGLVHCLLGPILLGPVVQS